MSLRFFSVFLFFLILFQGCTTFKIMWYQEGDSNDYKLFESKEISSSEDPYFFQSTTKLPLPKNLVVETKPLDLISFLESTHTEAFLIIRQGQLIHEWYGPGFDEESIVTSFSVAKSLVGALVGIALEEGHLESLEMPITPYFPQLASETMPPIRLKHLLQMTSGVRFTEESSFPHFADVAYLYYANDLSDELNSLSREIPPGEKFRYQSVTTQLMAGVLEAATQKSLATLLEEKLWHPLGMQYSAFWSTDAQGQEKAFCCLNGRAIDFAKIGQLYLQQGRWNEQQIIPEAWVEQTLLRTEEEGSAMRYQYHWWPHPKKESYTARGYRGQYLFVSPEAEMVIVRFGNDPNSLKNPWLELFEALKDHYHLKETKSSK